jgi:hypothetical protein
VLVASDGVTGTLPVPVLAGLLARPGVGAADLVRAAVDAGSRDDATALLADLDTVAASRDTVAAGRDTGHTRYADEGAEVRAR